MLVSVVDSSGAVHQVSWQGQDQLNDYSGTLGAAAVGANPQPQQVMPANALRAGFLFQNVSPVGMWLYEDGTTLSPWYVAPYQSFPPCNYPIVTGAIYVTGTNLPGAPAASLAGDTFTCREFVNASNE